MSTWHVDTPRQLSLEGETAQLDVWLAAGKLRVIGTDGPPRVDVSMVGRRGVTVSLEDGVLSVRHPIEKRWWLPGPLAWFVFGRRNYRVHVTIAVPPTAAASLTMISGSVVASGLRRRASVDVTSGSITLMGLGGTVRAKTVSGSIQALGIAGELSLETVSGEITLADSSAERVFSRTISGAVTCDLDNPFARDVHLETTSGEITIRVPADADLDVRLGATSGRVRSAFPEVRAANRPGTHTASGRIGAGTGTLNAHAISGSVSLLARPLVDLGDEG